VNTISKPLAFAQRNHNMQIGREKLDYKVYICYIEEKSVNCQNAVDKWPILKPTSVASRHSSVEGQQPSTQIPDMTDWLLHLHKAIWTHWIYETGHKQSAITILSIQISHHTNSTKSWKMFTETLITETTKTDKHPEKINWED